MDEFEINKSNLYIRAKQIKSDKIYLIIDRIKANL